MIKQEYGQNLHNINKLKTKINTLLHHEEVFWRQRSRSVWLKAGDKNTRFFHQRASQRHIKKNIDGLNDREGIWQFDMSRITTITEEYYTYLFTASHLRNMERVLEAVDKAVTRDIAHSLTKPHTKEEVKVALFSMHPSKSPGLDGISPFFFQKYWHIVGHDVMLIVLSVLHSSRCLKKMNFTHIGLISKKNDP